MPYFSYEELNELAGNIPKGIEFSIEYRQGESQLFSAEKGLIDRDVVALVAALQRKLFVERGLLQDPFTINGMECVDDDYDYIEKGDSLFHAIKWVWYDDKNGLDYTLHFDEKKLTFLGARLIDSLRKSNYMMSLGVGDAENPSAVFGSIGEFF